MSAMTAVSANKHGRGLWPHEGACDACRAEGVCNGCGASIVNDVSRCVNGRCNKCHRKWCGEGGDTSPGHGFWRRGMIVNGKLVR